MKQMHNIKLLICKDQSKSDHRQRLFKKGREKLQQELDALTLLKYVRRLDKLIDIKVKLTTEEENRVEKAKYKKITLKEDELTLQQKNQTRDKILKPFGSLEGID